MRVMIFGATGMVGQGVLRESLLAPDVEQVLAVIRSPTGVHHPKLREVKVEDFADLTPIRDELTGYDACFYCLGASSVGMTEADYTRVSYDYPMAAARLLAEIDPQTCFVYVSGAGTNPQGRQMWARVKGRTELEVIELLPRGYAVRPGMIQPTHGVRSKTRWYNAIYTAVAPAIPLLERIAPKYVTTTDRLARSMLQLARVGFPRHILENADLR
ncbi:NAD-dependent epimerase/dehydratase family protein [Paractinoplanes toevensis]|uniref:Epimerase n=1 Tax=Paractinoplanes toevensis TaxID=571911 RepID=A0A919WCN6_9ACTN|nr:NAD-dependent epimerase/dehydratase family protein [Actinoplanes toevensis]GIM97789.1 epimerase [Actinoplanes toevensis]